MTIPNRALITAPVARDLFAETGRPVARIPGAANQTLQLWDTLDEDYFIALADGQLTIYGSLQAIPNAVRKYCLQFATYDSVLATSTPIWKRWQDCTVLDFIKTQNGVKAITALIAADRPLEWDLLHRWAGNIAETLGVA